MEIEQTGLPGLVLLKPRAFKDHRGYFFEKYNQQTFNKLLGRQVHFVQDNQSLSAKGVLRGLHYQIDPMAQAKLVSVLNGRVIDIVVDLRKGSPTFGQHYAVELNDQENNQLFVPRGFAHGFVALEENTRLFYKCDNFYDKDLERGIAWNDPALGFDWQLPPNQLIISEKDQQHPVLANADFNFSFQESL